jgi:hypothetical protein
MQRIIFLMIGLLFCSCKSLPIIQPFDKPLDVKDKKLCSMPFVEGKWQFIHSIEATMPNRKKAFLIGITNISSTDKKISTVMMTIEGLVLFEAQYDTQIKINKGVPPFDSKEFAMGIIEDVKLMFFRPEGKIEQIGYLKDGSRVCRYRDESRFFTDINIDLKKTWEIRKYNNYRRMTRLVNADTINVEKSNRKSEIPQKIELFAYGKHKYSLVLNLIEAKQLPE